LWLGLEHITWNDSVKRTNGILMCCVGTLLALGLVMVFSIISARATTVGVGVKYLAKHLLWAGIGLTGLLVMSRLNYRWLQKRHVLIGIVAAVLLVAVLVPGIGTERNGARRWIRLGPVGFQPSELAKLALIVMASAMVAKRGKRMREFRAGFVPCMAVTVAASALIIAEPDFGTAALVGGIGTLLILAGGARFRPIAAAGAVGLGALSLLVWQSPARLARIFAFLDPWKYKDGAGYQVIQSLTALGSGGLVGRTGMQELYFLPEPDTDFILSIIGEQFGLIGTVAVILLFVIITRQGMRISERAPDAFGALLALGITAMIALQAIMHIAVVTASMPTKGIALPFVSSGGSSLVVSMAGIGMLMNIASQSREGARQTNSEQNPATSLVALPGSGPYGHGGG